MTTRLNRNTFAIEFMNTINYVFTFFYDSSVGLPKFFGMPCTAIGKRALNKLNQLFADWLLVAQKGMYIFKNFSKRCASQSPAKLVSSSCVFANSIDKVNASTKSLQEPFKHRRFSVVTLKLNLIDRVFISWPHISLSTKAAFSIYKTGKISKVFNSWRNGISDSFKRRFHFFRNKIAFMFKKSHMLNNGFFFAFGCFLQEISKCFCMSLFFDKVINNIVCQNGSLLASYGKRVKSLAINCTFVRSALYASSKYGINPKKNLWVYRRYSYCGRKFGLFRVFWLLNAYVKGSIAINIASYIRKICCFKI